MRILFVGGPSTFSLALSAYLGELGQDWQIHMAADGRAAIDAVAQWPIDVVIVAPVLADLATTTLLGQIRTLRPETGRIALIDVHQAERAAPARVIGAAHRLLPMPLAPEALLEAVTSLEELRELLDNPRLGASIGRIEKLPSPPYLYLSLIQALEEDEHADAGDVAALISGDPAIAAKVLQLCNSAFFSGGRSIADLRTAVTRLGISTLRDLVLASEVFSIPSIPAAQRAAMQQRALLSSRLAARILPPASAELGSTAALLADIGLLLPGIRDQRTPPAGAHDQRPGHGEAGAYLLGLWGLPMPIIEAVAFHLHPRSSGLRSFWVTGAVHVATALASGNPVDEEYLQRVGALPKLPAWREQAEKLMGLAEGA